MVFIFLVNDLNSIFVLLPRQERKSSASSFIFISSFFPFFSDYIWTQASTYGLGEAPFAKRTKSFLTGLVTFQQTLKMSLLQWPPLTSNNL